MHAASGVGGVFKLRCSVDEAPLGWSVSLSRSSALLLSSPLHAQRPQLQAARPSSQARLLLTTSASAPVIGHPSWLPAAIDMNTAAAANYHRPKGQWELHRSWELPLDAFEAACAEKSHSRTRQIELDIKRAQDYSRLIGRENGRMRTSGLEKAEADALPPRQSSKSLIDCPCCCGLGFWCRGCGGGKYSLLECLPISNLERERIYAVQFGGCGEDFVPCFACNRHGRRPADGTRIVQDFWRGFKPNWGPLTDDEEEEACKEETQKQDQNKEEGQEDRRKPRRTRRRRRRKHKVKQAPEQH